MERAEWFEAARAHARDRWSYGEALDEIPEWFEREFGQGTEPKEAVDRLAEKYDWIEFESNFSQPLA
jgi:hypothetical protein